MPQSLHRTWAALALAAVAVLVVAFLIGRDFVREVYPECPGSLVLVPLPASPADGDEVAPVYFDSGDPTTASSQPSFQLLFDEKQDRGVMRATRYANVRVVWKQLGQDGKACTCGSVSVANTLSGETPSDLHLFRTAEPDTYVVHGRSANGTNDAWKHFDEGAARASFRLERGPAHRFQADRILTQRHLPALVVLFALGALVVALFRSRRAMSYALRLHAWTAGHLTTEGVIESETGTPLGTLEQTGSGSATLGRAPGPILVAPAAIPNGALYRDMPIVPRRSVAEGTHARWAAGTMVRLRDARALAIISTACTALAFGARLIA